MDVYFEDCMKLTNTLVEQNVQLLNVEGSCIYIYLTVSGRAWYK